MAVEAYGAVLREIFGDFPGTLVLEPGRWLVAEAGVLLTRAIRIKPAENRTFLVVDAAMNDLQRPAMYDAWHEIVPLHGRSQHAARYDVVGPVCESSDTFGVDRMMPACEAGDLLIPEAEGAIGPGHVAGTLADLVAGRGPSPAGSGSPGGPRLFKSVGMAWEDLAVAVAVYLAAGANSET